MYKLSRHLKPYAMLCLRMVRVNLRLRAAASASTQAASVCGIS